MEASLMDTLLGEAEAARQQELNLPPQEPWRNRGAERHAADGRMRQASQKSPPEKGKTPGRALSASFPRLFLQPRTCQGHGVAHGAL